MALIKGIDHVTISVADRERSMEFYRDLLELPYLETVEQEEQDIIYFGLTDVCRLELIVYQNDEPSQPIRQLQKGCLRHFALLTDDLDAVWNRMLEHNVPVRMEPLVMEDLGCRGFLVEDPNGVEVEVTQKL